MNNILIPIAGKAQRFIDAGFTMPKPLIVVHNKHMIDWAMDSVDCSESNLIFVVRKDHINEFGIDKVLKEKFGKKTLIVSTDKITRGTLSTCLLAKDYIDNEDSLTVYTPDVYFLPRFSLKQVESNDGFILTFKANNPAHSYVKLDENGYALVTAEKQVISEEAAVGIYYYKTGKIFVKYAQEMEEKNVVTNNEIYVCPMYNFLIRDGLKIKVGQVEKMHVLGTPSDVLFFTKNVVKKFGQKPVSLCCDHSGLISKKWMIEELKNNNVPFIDFGTYIDRGCDQYDFLSQVFKHFDNGDCDFGISFCRTGQSFNIYANKHKDIRSAIVFDGYTAEYAIRHNCANFFSIPEKYINKDSIKDIVKSLLNSTFDGGRHFTRIQKFESQIK